MKTIRILFIFILALVLCNTTYAQEPAMPIGTPNGATKIDGKLYINGLLYPPVFNDTPQVNTLYYPKRNGAIILKQVNEDSADFYVFIGHWKLWNNQGISLSNYYDTAHVDSIVAKIRSEIPQQVNADWNATIGPAAILNKPVIPQQPTITGTSPIQISGSGNSVVIGITPNTYIPETDKASINGVATLDGTGKIPLSQLPAITLNQPVYVQHIQDMLNSSANVADVYVVGDSSSSYALAAEPPSDFANWIKIQSPTATTTDQLPEGINNKYFNNTLAIDALTGQNISIFNNDLNYTQRTELLDSLSKVVYLSGAQTLGAGQKTFTDSLKVITPSLTDNSKNAINSEWVQSQKYLKSIGTFPSGTIPYANSQGILTYKTPGLTFDGNSTLSVGIGGFYNNSAISLNGGNGVISASGWGVNIVASGGQPADASKSINFYNGSRRWLQLYMPNTDPTTTPLEGGATMNFAPSIDDSFDLGKANYMWRNLYTKKLYVDGVEITGSGTSTPAVTAFNLRVGNIVPQQVDYASFYKDISYVPAWTEITGKPTFATVATSGSYNDLLNKPSIPTDNNQIGNSAGYFKSVDTANKWWAKSYDISLGQGNDSSYFTINDLKNIADTVQFVFTGSSSGGSSYTLPIASSTTLGGVKIGTGLNIDANGILNSTGGELFGAQGQDTSTTQTRKFSVIETSIAFYSSNNANPLSHWYFSGSDLGGSTAELKLAKSGGSSTMTVTATKDAYTIQSVNITGQQYFTIGLGTGPKILSTNTTVPITLSSAQDINLLFTGKLNFNNIVEYTDNAAAVSAGLQVGTVYRTGDDLKIVH